MILISCRLILLCKVIASVIKLADNDIGQDSQQKSGDQFIQVKYSSIRSVPQDHGQASADYSGDSTRRVLPVQ